MKGLVSLLAIWMLFISVQTCLCDQALGTGSAEKASSVVLFLEAAPDTVPALDYCSGQCCIDYLLSDGTPFLLPRWNRPPLPSPLLPPPEEQQADIFTPPRLDS